MPKTISCTNVISMLSGICDPKKERKSIELDNLFVVNPRGVLVITHSFPSTQLCFLFSSPLLEIKNK